MHMSTGKWLTSDRWALPIKQSDFVQHTFVQFSLQSRDFIWVPMNHAACRVGWQLLHSPGQSLDSQHLSVGCCHANFCTFFSHLCVIAVFTEVDHILLCKCTFLCQRLAMVDLKPENPTNLKIVQTHYKCSCSTLYCAFSLVAKIFTSIPKTNFVSFLMCAAPTFFLV